MRRLAWCSSISLAMSALSSHTTDWMRLCSGVLPCAHTMLHQEHCCCCCCCVSKAEARDGVRQGSTGAQGMTLLWSGPFRRGSGGGWGVGRGLVQSRGGQVVQGIPDQQHQAVLPEAAALQQCLAKQQQALLCR